MPSRTRTPTTPKPSAGCHPPAARHHAPSLAILQMWGGNIKNRRDALGLTMAALAARVGVRPNAVLRWERGRVEPSLPNRLAIATALGSTPDDLFPHTVPTPTKRRARQK